MNRNALIAGGVAVGLVAGVVGTKLWLSRKTERPPVASGPIHVMSTGGDLLKTCKTFTDKYHPDRAILIKIPGTFDIGNLNPVIKEYGVNASWTGPDLNNPLAGPTPPTWTPRTPLDLNLDLADVPNGKKPDKILIQIQVEDPNVKFRQDGYAIEAGNVNGNGAKMLCQFNGGFQTQSATFMALYFSDNDGSKPTYGAFNIGLVSGNGQPFQMPIFIDPEVENNG